MEISQNPYLPSRSRRRSVCAVRLCPDRGAGGGADTDPWPRFGNADIAAAKAAQANIAEEFAKYGIKPESPAVATAPSAPASPPAADCARAETHWKSAEEIRTLAVYEDHLARFSTCDFAALARARIEALKK